ncbi:MAG: TfoX/Sxy family protein, partial [Thermoleophilia bacterium]|nr:TfoX/Sxy family protein [Thermoleophilia bacterium]
MSREFAEHVVDLLQAMGPVDARSMFGGYGIFLDGLMFGLIADEVLYLKVDEENRPEFEELGLGAFVYEGKN